MLTLSHKRDGIRKRGNLLSYAAAELEVEEMIHCTNSDVDSCNANSSKRCIQRKEYPQFDYNNMLGKGSSEQSSFPQYKNSKKINISSSSTIQMHMMKNEYQTPQNVTGELIYPSMASNPSKEIAIEIFDERRYSTCIKGSVLQFI
ncbi:hypothetical protein FQA39_LY16186 [Lamprigera yunnana]|nr:hypothetical protein FQA39_LY16186 [Lamprigera yunnana]